MLLNTNRALQQLTYSSSVDIRPEWPVVESIPFTSLAKLNFTVGKPEDVAFCGALEYYDKVYDRVTPKVDRPLKRTNKVFKSVTTSDDPVIRCARAIIDLRHTPMQTPMQKHVFVLRCCLDQIYTVQRPFLYKSDIFVSQTAVDHTWRTCHCQLVPSHLECNMLSSLQQHCDA